MAALISMNPEAVALVDGRASRQERVSGSRPTVQLQWTEPRINGLGIGTNLVCMRTIGEADAGGVGRGDQIEAVRNEISGGVRAKAVKAVGTDKDLRLG